MRHVFLAIPIVLLVACNKSSDKKPTSDKEAPTGSTTTAAPASACALVTQKDAEAVFGNPAKRFHGTGKIENEATECDWDHDFPDGSSQLLQLDLYPAAEFQQVHSEGAQPLSVGEKGYITTGEALGIEIGFVHKDKFVLLSYPTTGPSAPKALDRIDAVKALAKKLATEP